MKTKICILVVLIFITGCPARKIESIKPDPNANNPVSTAYETPKRTAESTDPRRLVFPVTESKITLSSIHTLSIIEMDRPLCYFWKTTGQFPDSIREWILSGYPLIWPRDVLRGTPVRVANLDNATPSEDIFGSFQYVKHENNRVEIKYIAYDMKRSWDTKQDEWKLNTYILPDSYAEDSASIVNGGKKEFDEIKDPVKKKLFLYCVELSCLLNDNTSSLFVKQKILPSSINDLLFADKYIIKENFRAFTQILESSNAELKFGFDYNKKTYYFSLTIDNEPYILHCVAYGDNQSDQQIRNCEEIENLDMTSPLLTNNNISSVNIPEQYMISIKDIPMGI